LSEEINDLCLFNILAAIRKIALCKLAHSLFDLWQVVLAARDRSDNVVKETVPRVVHQRRTDAEFRARIQIEHRRRKQMRGRVTDNFQPVTRVGSDRLYGNNIAIAGDLPVQIDLDTVHLRCERFFERIAVNGLYRVRYRSRRRDSPLTLTNFYVYLAHNLLIEDHMRKPARKQGPRNQLEPYALAYARASALNTV